MTPTGEHGGVVEYPIKDILEDIKRSIQSIDEKLDAKANVVEVVQIRKDLDDVKKAITELQTAQKLSEGWKRWAAPLLVSIAMLIVAILALNHSNGK